MTNVAQLARLKIKQNYCSGMIIANCRSRNRRRVRYWMNQKKKYNNQAKRLDIINFRWIIAPNLTLNQWTRKLKNRKSDMT